MYCTIETVTMEALSNPFPVTGYQGPDYFCDREEEFKRLFAAAKNGRNLTLVARRRIGKTSLLHHFAHLIEATRPSWKVIYIDLIKTDSLRGLYELMAKSLFLERKKSKAFTIPDLSLLGRLRMTLGMDPITQLPQASFDIKDDQVPQSIQFLFDWIRPQKRMVIVFDEFQQILHYREKNVEALLRSEMQRLNNVRFIYSGSDQHLLQEMFNHAKRPFYQSTESMTLLPIDKAVYKKFIAAKFKSHKSTISDEALEFIITVTEGETYAVQRLCNAIYEISFPHITLPLAQQTLVRVLDQQQPNYERVRALLNPKSNLFKVLRAIAKLGIVTETYGKDILRVSQIHNASSVNKAIKSLYSHGVISQIITKEGTFGYCVDDALFRLWLVDLSV